VVRQVFIDMNYPGVLRNVLMVKSELAISTRYDTHFGREEKPGVVCAGTLVVVGAKMSSCRIMSVTRNQSYFCIYY